jgi:macrodomain Ter protein organizer (MatP/YcbG family)
MTQDRNESGQFAAKSEEYRHVRSIRLTDTTWEKIGFAAERRRITRADLIEQMAEDGVFDGELKSSELSSDSFQDEIKAAIEEILSDSTVTRGGKDRGAVKRGLQALLNRLQ